MAVDDLDPAALMPLETPLLKVSRPVAACSRCRNAKIKCDGKLPACSSCEKNGRAAECTSTNDQFARGKERSYVSTLETRLDKLQLRLEDARNRKPSVISIPDDETAAPSRRTSYSVQEMPTPTTSKAQRRKEAVAIDDLVSDFGFLSVNATARDFHGFTTAMSYARLILSACTKDQLPQGTTKDLPPRYAATQLIQHYLNNVFVLLPVFEESAFYTSVENVYSGDPRRQPEAFDYWVVHMVLAIANASMSEQRGDHHYLEGIGHVCAAIVYAEDVLHPGAISSVQALVLLTEYAMLDPHHLDSWSLIGVASRAMVDLGLHQDPPKGTAMPKAKLELRRRVFHCVYALDRSTSLVQTRAFSFSDDSAKVKIPFVKTGTNQPAPTNGGSPQKAWFQSYDQALDLTLLRQLQSIWYTELFQCGRERWEEPYPYIWNTCDAMRKWSENILPSTPQIMRAFFELELLYSYVYVLSPSPRVPVIDSFAAKLIYEYCIRYADLTLRLINDPSYTAPMTFYDAMRVYMTGRQFLDVLNHNTDALLNGFVPNHPQVRPSTAPPPAMPVMPLPPGDNLPHFNTIRSIHCIKQITECLSKFGRRWGYMSWSQRYQAETAVMLEQLSQKLRELDDMAGQRRPSMWQHTSSTGSVHSSNGSIPYASPQSMPAGPAAYRQPSVTAYHMASYGGPAQPPQVSPPPFATNPFAQQPMQPFADGHPIFHAPPGDDVNFNGALAEGAPYQRPPPNFGAPAQQFAGWAGYGGPSAPDTLDDENARRMNEIAPFNSGDAAYAKSNSSAQNPDVAQSSYPSSEAQPMRLDDQHALSTIHSVDSGLPPSPLRSHPPNAPLGSGPVLPIAQSLPAVPEPSSAEKKRKGSKQGGRNFSIGIHLNVPSRLSHRRKNLQKQKQQQPPTSAPQEGGEPSKLARKSSLGWIRDIFISRQGNALTEWQEKHPETSEAGLVAGPEYPRSILGQVDGPSKPSRSQSQLQRPPLAGIFDSQNGNASSSVAPQRPPTRAAGQPSLQEENQRPIPQGLEVNPMFNITTVMPPLSGRGPAPQSIGPFDRRRSSMMDFVADMHWPLTAQDYVTGHPLIPDSAGIDPFQPPYLPPRELSGSPRAQQEVRQIRRNDKGKAPARLSDHFNQSGSLSAIANTQPASAPVDHDLGQQSTDLSEYVIDTAALGRQADATTQTSPPRRAQGSGQAGPAIEAAPTGQPMPSVQQQSSRSVDPLSNTNPLANNAVLGGQVTTQSQDVPPALSASVLTQNAAHPPAHPPAHVHPPSVVGSASQAQLMQAPAPTHILPAAHGQPPMQALSPTQTRPPLHGRHSSNIDPLSNPNPLANINVLGSNPTAPSGSQATPIDITPHSNTSLSNQPIAPNAHLPLNTNNPHHASATPASSFYYFNPTYPYLPIGPTFTPQPPPPVPGFMTLPDITGYMCTLCHRLVQHPVFHSTNGMFCFDAPCAPFDPRAQGVPAGLDVDLGMLERQRLAGGVEARDWAVNAELVNWQNEMNARGGWFFA